jgi:hypothetical protein
MPAVLYTALLLPLVLAIKNRFKSYITKPKCASQHPSTQQDGSSSKDGAAAAAVDGLSPAGSYCMFGHSDSGISSFAAAAAVDSDAAAAPAAAVDPDAAAAAIAAAQRTRSSKLQVMFSLGEEDEDDDQAAAAAADYADEFDDSPLPPADFTPAGSTPGVPGTKPPKFSLRQLSTLLQMRLSNSGKYSISSSRADSDAAATDSQPGRSGGTVKSKVTSTVNFTVQRWKSLKRGVKKRFWPKKRSTWVLLTALAVAAMSYCFAFYSSTVIGAFTCMALAGPPRVPGEVDLAGVNFWVPDLQLKCWSGQHMAVVVFAVLLGLPLLVCYAWLLLVLAWPAAKHSTAGSTAAGGTTAGNAAAGGTAAGGTAGSTAGLQMHSSLASPAAAAAAGSIRQPSYQQQQQQLWGRPSRRLIETESGPVTSPAAAAAVAAAAAAAKLRSTKSNGLVAMPSVKPPAAGAATAAAGDGAVAALLSPQATMSTPFATADSLILQQQQQQGLATISPSSSGTAPGLSPVPSSTVAASTAASPTAAAAAAPSDASGISSSSSRKPRGLFGKLWWFVWGLPCSILLRVTEKYVRKCQVHTVKRGVNGLQCAGLAVWNVQWRWWWLLLREVLKFAVILTAGVTSMRQPPQVQALLVTMMVAFACFLTWQLMVGCTTSMERLLFTQCCWLQLLAVLVLLLTLPGLNWSGLGFVLLVLILLKVLQDALMLALLVWRCVAAGRELSGLEGFADDEQ